jgi:tetratricopeptide (TPR) repeat protein
MDKSCSSSGCKNLPMFLCKSDDLHFCKAHQNICLMKKGDHTVTLVVEQLNEIQEMNVTERIKNVVSSLEKFQKTIANSASGLIRKINEKSLKLFKSINSAKQKYELCFKDIKINKIMNKDKYKLLWDTGYYDSSVYDFLSDSDECLNWCEWVSKIQTIVLDDHDEDLSNSYNIIGESFNRKGEYENALEYFNKCLDIREDIITNNQSDLAEIYKNIGNVLYRLEKYEEALDFDKKVLKIKESILKPGDRDLACAYMNIGSTTQALKQFDEALSYFKRCLEIREKKLSPNHIDLSHIYSSLGECLSSLKKFQDSYKFYKKAVKIQEAVYPPNSPNLIFIYNSILLVAEKLKKQDKIEIYERKLLEIQDP